MLANLMPPPSEVRLPLAETIQLRTPEIIVRPTTSSTQGFLVVHPRYRSWLQRAGILTAADALNLQGEIISGHPDRHVLHVRLPMGTSFRGVFIKREHRIGWSVRLKNWRAGFGAVSRSEREARILSRLEEAGLPGPNWIAYGEDGGGRAFVMIDELSGHRDLREILRETRSAATRRVLIAQLARAVAQLHAAGYDTPDLSAKHLFVRPGVWAITLIDWLSSGGQLTEGSRLKSLAALHASLADELATPRERLRFLRQYHRHFVSSGPDGKSSLGWKASLPTLLGLSAEQLNRSSIREQRLFPRTDMRLVWLAGEAVCAIPDVAKRWPQPAITEPYYRRGPIRPINGERVRIRLEDGRPAMLVRYCDSKYIQRRFQAQIGRNWRSQAVLQARLLWHLERHGVPVPPLYAFGQRSAWARTADSFLVYGLPNGGATLATWFQQPGLALQERRHMLETLGRTVRAVHDASAQVGANPDVWRVILLGTDEQLLLDPVAGVQRVKNLDEVGRLRDCQHVLAMLGCHWSRTDRLRFLRGYFHQEPPQARRTQAHAWWHQLSRTVRSA